MLAAAPSQQIGSLELVRLALLMIQGDEPNIPTSLKEYFTKVLSQAKILAQDPSELHSTTLPEAIDLALEIRSVDQFSKELENVESTDSISPAIAKKLLHAMEKPPVYSN